jgi:hypothetical protein
VIKNKKVVNIKSAYFPRVIFTQSFQVHQALGVYSACNGNEYQKQKDIVCWE